MAFLKFNAPMAFLKMPCVHIAFLNTPGIHVVF